MRRLATILALLLSLSILATGQSAVGRLGNGVPVGSTGGGGGGLLTATNFVYQGSFRLPTALAGSNNGFQYYGFGGAGGVAFNPAGNGGLGSLILSGSEIANDIGDVAEVTIPALVLGDHPTGGSTNVLSLNTAAFLPGGCTTCFFNLTGARLRTGAGEDPTYGHSGGDNGHTYGMLVDGGKLYVQVGLRFDSPHVARANIFRHGLTLSVDDFFGWDTVRDSVVSTAPLDGSVGVGMMQGYLSDVPSALQSSLGGTAIASAFYGMSIISRTSLGPSAFVWTPSQVGSDTPSTDGGVASSSPLAALGLVWYYGSNPTHPTLGYYVDTDYDPLAPLRRSSPKTWFSWGDHSSWGILEDQTYFIGQLYGVGHATSSCSGLDEITGWYGDSTTDWCLNGTVEGASDLTYSFNSDVPVGTRAQDAWPFVHRIITYRVSDLQAVKASTKSPWEPVPVTAFDLPLPFDFALSTGGSSPGTRAAYDRANRLLYIVQPNSADFVGSVFPMVHVYHITASSLWWICLIRVKRRDTETDDLARAA